MRKFVDQQSVLNWMRDHGIRIEYNSLEKPIPGNRYHFVANDLYYLLIILQNLENKSLNLIKTLQNIESFSALAAKGSILEQINVFASKALFDVGELEEKEKCDICGDVHEDEIPRECETGDGV